MAARLSVAEVSSATRLSVAFGGSLGVAVAIDCELCGCYKESGEPQQDPKVIKGGMHWHAKPRGQSRACVCVCWSLCLCFRLHV